VIALVNPVIQVRTLTLVSGIYPYEVELFSLRTQHYVTPWVEAKILPLIASLECSGPDRPTDLVGHRGLAGGGQ